MKYYPLLLFHVKQNLDRFIEYGFKNSVLLIDSDGERDVDKVIEFINQRHIHLKYLHHLWYHHMREDKAK